MGLLGDVMATLEKVPGWKRLKGLAAEHDALKARVEALEREVAKRPAPDRCPLCGSDLKVTEVKPHEWGPVEFHRLECTGAECSYVRNKTVDLK